MVNEHFGGNKLKDTNKCYSCDGIGLLDDSTPCRACDGLGYIDDDSEETD